MVSMLSGLILTPHLVQRNVSIDLKFEPSVGILARKVDKLGMDIRSFREPLTRSVREVMVPSIRMNFDVGGRPAWEPLHEFTVKKKKGNAAPLIRTGALRRVASQINIWTISSESAMITDLPQSVWYGKVHQAGHGATGMVTKRIFNPMTKRYTEFEEEGTEAGSGAIPARPFVVLQEQDVIAIERVFADWLGERIAANGLGGSAL
jgi:phage gpG-like protein